MNPTLTKFGHPNSLLKDYQHWCVLLRPAQVTIGSLVLCSKGKETAWGQLSLAAFSEMQMCISDIEKALGSVFHFDKINYLALMMVDPNVHFHVLPRYAAPVEFSDQAFTDAAWPGPPDLKQKLEFSESQQNALKATLLDAFRSLR